MVAAKFAKADLVSQVVIEFPSLQGRVGGIYAEKAGAAPAIAQAVADHYRPLSAAAPVPGTLAGGLLATAEKIDNIVGAWVAGEKPSGSRDPYGLRRAAMGIVRIALEYDLTIPPRTLASAAVRGTRSRPTQAGRCSRHRLLVPIPRARSPSSSGNACRSCSSTRACRSRWSRRRWARAPFGADLPRVAALARAFARVEHKPYFNDVVTAYTRPAALAAKAETDPSAAPAAPDRALFADEAEHALADALAEVRGPVEAALAGGDVEAALCAAAALRGPVDRYFDEVLVMDKDQAVRANRLAQLRELTELLGALGDFGRLPVQQS